MSTSSMPPPPLEASNLPPAAASKRVFLTASTGYIGGTVLTKLLSLSVAPAAHFTLLLRDPKKAELLSQLTLPKGVTLSPLIGSLQDYDKLKAAAEEHDVVVHCADADDVGAIKAILEGMKARKDKTGHRGILIHTSGTGVLTDDARGEYPNDIIYTDLNPTPATSTTPALRSMADLPDDAFHRNVDLLIVNADKAGDIKSHIVLPSTIWGVAKGQLFDIGYANAISIQMPTLIRAALDRGQAGMVGKGANIWPHVSISDVGDLYTLVYAGALRGDIGHGASGYYLGIAGEYTLLAAAQTIGAELVRRGWAADPQPTTFTTEDLDKYYAGNYYMGTNSRGVADRSKSIGWRPRYARVEDMFESLKEEVGSVEKKHGRQWTERSNKY